MAALDDIVANLPIGDIAAKLGVDEATARQAVDDALPALLAGLGANAADPAGAASLEKAVAKHDPKLIEGGVNLADVDEEDGKKIVKNVFGDNTDKVVTALDKKEGGAGDLIGKLLPILAPIVLSFLAAQFTKKQAEPAAASNESSGGGIGDLLGGLLGGGSGSSGTGGGGGIDLGGLVGGLLGGGSGSGSGGGLGDLLGGLLGGGKR
jgi:hypothetical protein